jgi:hypothetical protein
MIHRPIDPDELTRRISALVPNWLDRAARQTAINEAARCHSSINPLWSEIKSVFVAHQQEKCAYCERRLGSAGIEWDLEHFRPKARVDAWSSPDNAIKRTGRADERGYFLLAFNQLNYLASCKSCNSLYKKNYFPVGARKRVLSSADPSELARERPYLLNPLDESDDPPERLIGFRGISPRVLVREKRLRRRAVITIQLLGLTRADLDYGRSKVLQDLWLALEAAEKPGESKIAQLVVENLTSNGSEFANCARSFKSLYEEDRGEAERLAREAIAFINPRSS